LATAPRASSYSVCSICSIVTALALATFILSGCTPAIGDRCTLSTDCSVQGNRICDTTQPGGYCTAVPCTADKCPDNAACVEVGASVPGCAYDDYAAPSRVASPMCLKTCSSNSDCRQSDGYTCGHPAGPMSFAVILDTDQTKQVCLIAPNPPVTSVVDAQVCSSSRVDVPPLDGASTLALGDGGTNGEADDAVSLADVELDAPLDATTDSTPVDGDGTETADATAVDGDGSQ